MTDHYGIGKEALLAAVSPCTRSLCGRGPSSPSDADAVEGSGAPLPQGLEPHPGRPGGYSGPHPADHRPASTVERRCAAAVSGAFLGILVTCVLGIVFTDPFDGAVMSYSESLLYSGYQDQPDPDSMVGSSGAVMDRAVDITSAVSGSENAPTPRWEAVRSGMKCGGAAMGTMTTTLLLAYSGGYVALLMVFMAQGTPLYNILSRSRLRNHTHQTAVLRVW